MSFEVFNPDSVHSTGGAYSHAVKLGNLLFVAGQVAQNKAGEIVGKDDALAQATQIFENLKDVLESCGSSMELVGKLTVYTTSLEYRPAIAEARKKAYEGIAHRPASTFVVISSLATPDYLVEIEAIALVKE
jgi:enamine deaminase RidA (YjgF/YER057c/UK114 family)